MSKPQTAGLLAFFWVVASLIGYFLAFQPYRYIESDLGCESTKQQGGGSQQSPKSQSRDTPSFGAEESGTRKYVGDDTCTQQRMKESARDQARFTYYGLWMLVGTLGFTAFAAVSAWLTWRTMKDTSKQQLRAYVNLAQSEMRSIEDLRFGKKYQLKVTFKNFGATPAYDVRAAFKINNVPESNTISDDEPFGAIGPGASAEITHVVTVFSQDIDDMETGNHLFYLSGTITYRDAFDITQTTDFNVVNGTALVEKIDGKYTTVGFRMKAYGPSEAT